MGESARVNILSTKPSGRHLQGRRFERLLQICGGLVLVWGTLADLGVVLVQGALADLGVALVRVALADLGVTLV